MTSARSIAIALLLTPIAVAAVAADADLQHVIPDAAAHQIGDTPYNIQGLSILLGIVGVIATILWGFRRMRRENEADAQGREERIKEAHRADAERIDRSQRERSEEIRDQLVDLKTSLGERVKAIEMAIVDFMPRREIESKIDHEKNNRVQSDSALERRQEATAVDVRDLLVKVGQLTQRQDGQGSELAEIKALIKDGNRDQAASIKELRDAIEQRGVRR